MNKLTEERDAEIRDALGHIAHNLHNGYVSYEDMFWAHKTIKELLFLLYLKKGDYDDG
ncbi:hypothetical protein [Sporosarcina sp. FSL W7-1283]|uniref:hypothetical protein n=1 Tax=Sporosarcina sp. FSL W7-1283 TaxID=2921560 RepID=UPI0030F91845